MLIFFCEMKKIQLLFDNPQLVKKNYQLLILKSTKVTSMILKSFQCLILLFNFRICMETAGMGGAIPAQGMGGAIQPQHFQYVTHNNLKVNFFSNHKVLQFMCVCH